MKYYIYIIIFVLGSLSAHAQIGYQLDLTRHTIVQKNTPNGLIPKVDLKGYGALFGSQYWFRLKNYRLEFIPGAHIGAFFNNDPDFKDYDVKDIYFMMDVPALIYPLMFKEDCNCPTFKKAGNLLEKGFHLIAQAGFSLNFRNITHDSVSTSKTTFTPVLGFGAGIDIGINKTLTLTPFVLYTAFFSDYFGRTDFDRIDINHHSLNAGLRLRIYKAKSKF
ncbi:MAG: hypothetical protein HOP11_07600 [Saprospiraceae bacterium]|nr:hypothetical protein [Saprospiraceae bacterium]